MFVCVCTLLGMDWVKLLALRYLTQRCFFASFAMCECVSVVCFMCVCAIKANLLIALITTFSWFSSVTSRTSTSRKLQNYGWHNSNHVELMMNYHLKWTIKVIGK